MPEIGSSTTEKSSFRISADICSFLDDKQNLTINDLTRKAAQEILEREKLREAIQKDRLTSE